jgi:metal-sulfur cluster biosynthetic enzyme
MTEDDVKNILKTVLDPELGVNIVDLGLIYEIHVTSDREQGTSLHIKMTLTTPGCPLGSYFVDMVKQALVAGLQIDEENIMVEITFDPPWSQELMSEEVKAQLGF